MYLFFMEADVGFKPPWTSSHTVELRRCHELRPPNHPEKTVHFTLDFHKMLEKNHRTGNFKKGAISWICVLKRLGKSEPNIFSQMVVTDADDSHSTIRKKIQVSKGMAANLGPVEKISEKLDDPPRHPKSSSHTWCLEV